MEKPLVSPLLQYVIGAGALVLVVAGLKAAAPIVTVILLAFLLAFSVTPILRWFLNRKLKTGLALILTLLVVLLGGLFVVSITAGSIVRLVDSLPKYEAGLTSLRDSSLGLLEKLGIDPSGILPKGSYGPPEVLALAATVLGAALDFLSNGVIIVLIMAFILADLADLYKPRRQQTPYGLPSSTAS